MEQIKEEILKFVENTYNIFKDKTVDDVCFRYCSSPFEENILQGILLKDKVCNFIVEDKKSNIFLDCRLVDPFDGSKGALASLCICRYGIPTENDSYKKSFYLHFKKSFTYYSVDVRNSMRPVELPNIDILEKFTSHICKILQEYLDKMKVDEKKEALSELKTINSLFSV